MNMLSYWSSSIWSIFNSPKETFTYTMEEFLDSCDSFTSLTPPQLEYISHTERLHELLGHVVMIPKTRHQLEPGDNIEELMKEYERSNTATSILYKSPLPDRVLRNGEILTKLWMSMICTPSAVVFGRILGVLSKYLKKDPELALEPIFESTQMVDYLLLQLGSMEAAEVLLWILILLDRKLNNEGTIQLLVNHHFMKRLVDILAKCSTTGDELGSSIAAIILNIAGYGLKPNIPEHIKFPHDIEFDSGPVTISPLVSQFEQSTTLEKFLRSLFSNWKLLSDTVPYLSIYLSKCDPYAPYLPLLIRGLLEDFYLLTSILNNQQPQQDVLYEEQFSILPQKTKKSRNKQYGPFGSIRMNVVRLLASLSALRYREITAIFISSGVHTKLLKLMKQYSMNSNLHNSIVKIFKSSCYDPDTTLTILRNTDVLLLLKKYYIKYQKASHIEKLKQSKTLQGLCLSKILSSPQLTQEMEKQKRWKLVLELLEFKRRSHFMGHMAAIAKLFHSQVDLGTPDSRNLRLFLEKHSFFQVWKKELVEEPGLLKDQYTLAAQNLF